MSRPVGPPGATLAEPPPSPALPPRPRASLLRNTVAQTSPALLGYVLSFLSAPIVVSGLGLRLFGVWALTGALTQYGGLLDFGIGRSLSRFVAAHEEDRRACGEYMAIGLASLVVLAAVLPVLAIALAPVLAGSLHIPVSEMRVALLSSVVLLLSGTASLVVAAYPVGRQRMVAPNVAIAMGAVLNFCASVGAIIAGAGLPGYAIANAAAGVISVALVTGIVVRVEGGIPLSMPGRARTKNFVRYGAKLQLAWAMELVNYQSDKIVIALSVGPTAAGSYELASRVAMAARQFSAYPSWAVLPMLTARFAAGGVGELRRGYSHFTQRIVTIAFPALVLPAALSPLLFGAWLGHVPPYSTVVLPALVITYLATVSGDLTKVVASAAGDPTLVARTAVGTAVVNLAVTATLAPFFGLWGVLVGTVIALTAGALLQVGMVLRQFTLPARAYTRAVWPSLGLCLALGAPVAALAYSGLITGRLGEAVSVVIVACVYAVAYVVLSLRAGRLPERVTTRVTTLVPSLNRFAAPA